MLQGDESISRLLEKLAQLEHDQWVHYSKDVARKIRNANSLDKLQESTLGKWKRNWKPYVSLSEAEKEKDRIWAHKVLMLIKDNESAVKKLFQIERGSLIE